MADEGARVRQTWGGKMETTATESTWDMFPIIRARLNSGKQVTGNG